MEFIDLKSQQKRIREKIDRRIATVLEHGTYINDEVIALKAFTYFPDNQAPHSTLYSQILVFDRSCGAPHSPSPRSNRHFPTTSAIGRPNRLQKVWLAAFTTNCSFKSNSGVADDSTSAIPRLLEPSGLMGINGSMAEAFGDRRTAKSQAYPVIGRVLFDPRIRSF